MGAAWALAYAYLHLGLWEEDEVLNSLMYRNVHTGLRYIDHVLMVWQGSIEDLHTFIGQLNRNERSIHLTYTFDQTGISFLDLWITVEEGQLHTHTFRKETVANTLLHADSHHPHWLQNGIPVGHFLRIKRNCTKTEDYKKEGAEMYKRFRERGYSLGQIRKAKKKAAGRSRESLLQKEDSYEDLGSPNNSRSVRIITAFGAQWNLVRNSLERHWEILTNSPGLIEIVGTAPKMVAHQAKNLGDMLIQSEFTKEPDPNWLSTYPRTKGMFPCNKRQICPFVDRTETFMDALNQEGLEIRDLIAQQRDLSIRSPAPALKFI